MVLQNIFPFKIILNHEVIQSFLKTNALEEKLEIQYFKNSSQKKINSNENIDGNNLKDFKFLMKLLKTDYIPWKSVKFQCKNYLINLIKFEFQNKSKLFPVTTLKFLTLLVLVKSLLSDFHSKIDNHVYINILDYLKVLIEDLEDVKEISEIIKTTKELLSPFFKNPNSITNSFLRIQFSS